MKNTWWVRRRKERCPAGKVLACCLTAMVPLIISAASASDGNLIDVLQGFYQNESSSCSEQDDDGKLQECMPPMQECLLIKKIDSEHASIDFYSPQGNLESCGVNGAVAQLTGKALVYQKTEKGPREPSNTSGFAITLSGRQINIDYDPLPSSSAAFCGIHANLEAMHFDADKKQDPKGQQCGP